MNPESTRPRPESPSPAWPDWKIERYLIGELPSGEARRLESAMRADAGLALRLRNLREEHARLRADHPSEAMAEGIARRLLTAGSALDPRPRRYAWPRLHLPAPVWAPALAMIMVLAILPFTPYSPLRPSGSAEAGPEGGSGGERLKGLKPRLLMHRKAAEGSVRLRDGERVRGGEVIQIQYESAGRAQGALFSLDAEGQVTRHLPDRGETSAPLESGGPVALGFAYELDDAPGWERFYLIASDRPFDLPAVEAALRRLRATGPRGADSLALPPGLEQSTFILLKEPGT